MKCNEIIFSRHAQERIYQRKIEVESIKNVIENGLEIREYPDDKPFPSILYFSFVDSRPIHVLIGINSLDNSCVVITVYEPDDDIWNDSFTKKI